MTNNNKEFTEDNILWTNVTTTSSFNKKEQQVFNVNKNEILIVDKIDDTIEYEYEWEVGDEEAKLEHFRINKLGDYRVGLGLSNITVAFMEETFRFEFGTVVSRPLLIRLYNFHTVNYQAFGISTGRGRQCRGTSRDRRRPCTSEDGEPPYHSPGTSTLPSPPVVPRDRKASLCRPAPLR